MNGGKRRLMWCQRDSRHSSILLSVSLYELDVLPYFLTYFFVALFCTGPKIFQKDLLGPFNSSINSSCQIG